MNIDPLVECGKRCRHFLPQKFKRTSRWQKPWKAKSTALFFNCAVHAKGVNNVRTRAQCHFVQRHRIQHQWPKKAKKKHTPNTKNDTKTFRQFWSNPTTWHYKRFCVSKTARQRKLCSQSNQLSRNVCLRAKLVASSASAFISLCSSRVVLQCVYLVLKYSAPLAERL